MADATPFLSLEEFVARFRVLTTVEQAIATDLLKEGSDWIRARKPDDWTVDQAAKNVLRDVVATALRAGPLAGLSSFQTTTDYRVESGTFKNPTAELRFEEDHYRRLGISYGGSPAYEFPENDFDAPKKTIYPPWWDPTSPVLY